MSPSPLASEFCLPTHGSGLKKPAPLSPHRLKRTASPFGKALASCEIRSEMPAASSRRAQTCPGAYPASDTADRTGMALIDRPSANDTFSVAPVGRPPRPSTTCRVAGLVILTASALL